MLNVGTKYTVNKTLGVFPATFMPIERCGFCRLDVCSVSYITMWYEMVTQYVSLVEHTERDVGERERKKKAI